MPSLSTFGRSAEDAKTAFLFGLLAVAFGIAMFNHGLVPSMEPRFAEAVREMIATGEWLIPTKNGRPYVEYPVFYYWLAIIGRELGLPMIAAIRLPTFAAFFAWLYVLGRWQRHVSPGLPAHAYQLAGAAIPIALFQFSIAQTDGLLVFGVMLAMYGYTRQVSAGTTGFPWALWLGVAIATLAKGPVGIACTLPVIFLDRFAEGVLRSGPSSEQLRVSRFRQVVRVVASPCWFRGLCFVLLISAPWYVLAGLQNGWEFVRAVLIYQNFDRYITGYSHSQPWWYYFKTIIYDFFPLSFLIPLGVWTAARRIRMQEVRFTLLWAGFTFLFFSISGSKQGKYLLPMAPAIVALAFMALEHLRQRTGRDLWRWLKGWCMALVAVFSLLITLVIPFYSSEIDGSEGFQEIRAQLAKESGQLISYQWPRSQTLYQLGAPMPFVRSARELYAGIANGTYQAGDYVLVRRDMAGSDSHAEHSTRLIPFPNPEVFETVLETEAGKRMILLRIVPGADGIDPPDTPEPPVLNWRDAMFDTD